MRAQLRSRASLGAPQTLGTKDSESFQSALNPHNTAFVSMINGASALGGQTESPKTWRSLITTEVGCTMSKLNPVTPGKLLLEELLKPMGLSQYRLAKEIDVPAQRISEIISGKRAITADTDLRLCRFFGLSDGYWLRAQAAHDTEVAERKLRSVLRKIRPWAAKNAGDNASDPSTRHR